MDSCCEERVFEVRFLSPRRGFALGEMAEEWKEREGGLEEATWILIVDNSLEELTGYYSVYVMPSGLDFIRRNSVGQILALKYPQENYF